MTNFTLTPPPADAKDQEEFIGWMIDRYVARSDADEAFARASAEEQLKEQGAEFGQAGYGWAKSDAYELADDEMDCWEGD